MEHIEFIVHLHKIPPEGLDLSWEITDCRSAGITLEVPVQGPVSARFAVGRFGNEIHVTGEVRGTLLPECSRCLKSFPLPFRGEVTATFAPPGKVEGEEHFELKEEDLVVEPLVGGGADLRNLIAEQIHLAFPIKPLCSEECRGICPRCGRDDTHGSCDCAPVGVDPRWEALRKLTVKS